MRTYADPVRCPDCGAVRVPGPRCGTCGLLLQGPLADRLWGLLNATDETLAQMRVERGAAVATAQTPAAPTTLPPLVPLPAGDVEEPSYRPPRRPVSVAAVLLGLGALLVVVAAFVFLAVAWGRLSLGGRALLLAGMTALAATVAALISRRGLRASAEAAWAVALAMLALDLAAARGTGLLGLDRPSITTYLTGAGLLLGLAGSAVAAAFRDRLRLALVVPQLVSIGGLAVAGASFLAGWDARVGWLLLVAAGFAGAVAVGARVLRLPLVAVVASVTAVLAGLAQIVVAWTDVVDARTWRAAWLDGAAWPSVASVAVLLVAGWAASRLVAEPDETTVPVVDTDVPADDVSGHRVDLSTLLVSLASFAAAGIALTWVLVPLLANASPLRSAAVLMAAALVLVLGCVPFTGAWGRGVRALAVLIGVGSFLGSVDDVIAAGRTLVTTVRPVWQQSLDARLSALDVAGPPWWSASLQLAVAAASVFVAARVWRWQRDRGPTWSHHTGPPVAVVLLVVACLLPVTALRTPVAVLCAVGVALGTALVVPALLGRLRPGQAPATGVVLALASYEALASAALSALTWGAVTALLIAVSVRLERTSTPRLDRVGGVLAALGVGLGVATLLATAETLDWSVRTTALLLVAVAVALLAGATALRRRPGVRGGLELAALLPALLAVAAAASVVPADGLAFLALVLTLLGAATALLSVLVPDRRRMAPLAGLVLAVAWWLRLAASDVSAIEAYTLPVAVLLLLAGLWALWRRPRTRSIPALLPGLLLATTPSLPAAVVEPSSARGLLLGLAALVLVGIGARLSWVAPFAVGASEAVLLALRHATPYADALPRWVLLATAGLLLLAAGTTWESRARQARRGLAAVRSMR